MKSLVGALKLELSQYEEVARFARFGTEVNETTQRQIERGMRLQSLLGQNPHEPVHMVDQVIMFFALTENYMDMVAVDDISGFAHDLLIHVHTHAIQLVDNIKFHRVLEEQTIHSLHEVISGFTEKWHMNKRGVK